MMRGFISYNKDAVGARIQKKRLALGLTQEKLDKSLRFVTEIERGAVGMSIETLLCMCGVLKTTPDEMLLSGTSEEDTELKWLIETLSNCPEAVRATAIEILRAYLKSV